jgi:DNA-binding XRE family transcriptional regulator
MPYGRNMVAATTCAFFTHMRYCAVHCHSVSGAMAKRSDRPLHMRVDVAKRLRALRRSLGLTRAEFAENANVLRTAYTNWEKGDNLPDIIAGISICEAYKVTLDWIYMGDPSGLRVELWEQIRHHYNSTED